MTRMTITLAAFAAIAAASPAAAQYEASSNGYAASDVDIAGLSAEIDAGVAGGGISGQEAATLRSQLRGLVNLQRQYAANGLSWRERNDLQQRAQGLRNEIAQAGGGYASPYAGTQTRPYGNADTRANGSQYGGYTPAPATPSNGYGSNGYGNNGYGSYATPSRPSTNGYGTNGYGTNGYRNDGYGTNGYGSNGYSSSPYNGGGYYNQGGRNGYSNYGSGYGANGGYYGNGAYANRYGQYDRTYRDDRDRNDDRYGDEDGYVLRAGDRAPDDLYAVPDDLRRRFRDNDYVYYRFGAGNVYQIDSRNDIVLRVIPVDR